jgi:hypothetical protein
VSIPIAIAQNCRRRHGFTKSRETHFDADGHRRHARLRRLLIMFGAAIGSSSIPLSLGSASAGPIAERHGALSQIDAPVLSLDTLHVRDVAQIGDHAEYRLYAGIVQDDIQSVLHKDEEIHSESYNIGISLWVSASGIVQRSEVFRSTGDHDRDASIMRVVRNVTISKPPPANMPQPVSVVIVSHVL